MDLRPGVARAPSRPSSGRAYGGGSPARPKSGQTRGSAGSGKGSQNGKDGRGSKLDKWDLQTAIAKGSFGTVYRAIDRESGKVYALKQVDLNGMKRVDREEAIDEARILASLDCQYITQHYDSFIEDNKLHIVMELADKGSLHAKMKAQHGRGLPEDAVWKYFIESLLALNYLHSKKIIHRDIKTLNIFLTESGDVMVGDLGVARAMSDNTDFCRTRLGTPYYLSPELCEDKPYNEKSDVWALGVVLYEMCMAVHPFTAANEGALIRKIMRGVYAPVTGYSVQIGDMVKTCLTYDHRRRPDTNALLAHPTIQSKAKALRISLKPTPRRRAPQQPPAPAREPRVEYEYHPNPPPQQQQQQQHYYQEAPPPDRTWTPPARAPALPADAAGWPEPAPPLPEQGWPAPAPAPAPAQYPRPADLAAQNRMGVGGAVPGGVDPYEATPPQRYQDHHHRPAPEPMRTAGAPRPPREGPLYGDPHAGGALAYDMEEKMRIRDHEAALRAAAANGPPQYARGAHPAQQDHMRDAMQGGYAAEHSFDMPRPGIHQGVDLRTAGRGPRLDSRNGPGPFAYNQDEHMMSKRHNNDERLWQVSTPTHGRRRAVDLQITGPSLRGSPGRPGSAQGGGAHQAGYYNPQGPITSTTTYASPSMAPSTFFG